MKPQDHRPNADATTQHKIVLVGGSEVTWVTFFQMGSASLKNADTIFIARTSLLERATNTLAPAIYFRKATWSIQFSRLSLLIAALLPRRSLPAARSALVVALAVPAAIAPAIHIGLARSILAFVRPL